MSVCVAAPIVPVALFARVTTSVRVFGVFVTLRRSQSGTEMLPAGSVTGSASAGVNVQVTGVPNATVTAASAPGGLRDSAMAGVLRR